MNKLCVVVVALGLSGLAWGTPIFSDDFSASTFTGWTVTKGAGTGGTATVTNGKEGYYAELYSYGSAWAVSRIKTQNVFPIGDGLVVDATMMFARGRWPLCRAYAKARSRMRRVAG